MRIAGPKAKRTGKATQSSASPNLTMRQRLIRYGDIAGRSGRDILSMHNLESIREPLLKLFNPPIETENTCLNKKDNFHNQEKKPKSKSLFRVKNSTAYAPSSFATTEAFGIVKWYDVGLGYGMITPDGPGFVSQNSFTREIKIDLCCLKLSGFRTIFEGTRIHCDIAESYDELQAVMVHGLDARLAPHPSQSPLPRHLSTTIESEWETAIVRDFHADRGFGFLCLAGGGSEIFVHIDTVKRHGLLSLEVGEELEVRWGYTDFGRIAVQLRPIGQTTPLFLSH